MAVSGLGVAYMAAGFVLLWSGYKNTTIKDTLTSFLKGQQPPANPTGPLTVSLGPDSGSTAPGTAAASAGAGISSAVGSVAGAASATGAKAVGAMLATAYGWGPGTQDWSYLETGWQEESGWSVTAANDPSDPYDHAYGIPQANPGTKMASAGSDWKTSAATQVRWGLGYIKATYGRPTHVPGWSANGPLPGYTGY